MAELEKDPVSSALMARSNAVKQHDRAVKAVEASHGDPEALAKAEAAAAEALAAVQAAEAEVQRVRDSVDEHRRGELQGRAPDRSTVLRRISALRVNTLMLAREKEGLTAVYYLRGMGAKVWSAGGFQVVRESAMTEQVSGRGGAFLACVRYGSSLCREAAIAHAICQLESLVAHAPGVNALRSASACVIGECSHHGRVSGGCGCRACCRRSRRRTRCFCCCCWLHCAREQTTQQ
jgi:hypothetical protein